MSAEFAAAEGCKEPSGVPPHQDRIAEIRALDNQLNAAGMLENMSHAVRWTDIAISPSSPVRYYLIRFDNARKRVEVEPYFAPRSAVLSYDNAETMDNQRGEE
jgi:hypothetical protein